MVYSIGLIGNLASGKSTVAAFFRELGIEIISADNVAKNLTTKNQPAFHQIITHFGPATLTDNGELNRRQLRELIFNNESERLWLENLLHPLIRKEIENTIKTIKSPYCLIEIPLFSTKANYPYLNRILLVKAKPEQQIARFIARDNSSRENALAILATQTNVEKHQELADDVLMNTGSLDELKEKVLTLHVNYLKLAADYG
jgi:dephospho-CoA kinase